MKLINILTLVGLMLLISCGREADFPKAKKDLFEASSFLPFSTGSKTVEAEMRAATLLVYPEPQDVESLVFDPKESETAEDWSSFLNDLTYQDNLTAVFTKEEDSFTKAMNLNQLIFAAGRYRDNALRAMDLNEKKALVEEKKVKIFESENDLKSVVCYYSKRPRSGKPYECKLVADETYKKKKKFSRCSDWSRFNILESERSRGEAATHQRFKKGCAELQGAVNNLRDASKLKKKNRSGAESVVLDLLLETEKLTDLVFAAKVSTVEKPDDIGPESILKFNNEGNKIEEFKLYIDFLPGNSTVVGYNEYSLENGKIKGLKVYMSQDGVRKVSFVLMLPDMSVEVDGDLSFEAGVMGMRLVDSQAFVRYKNGKVRRGVFKIEMNVK